MIIIETTMSLTQPYKVRYTGKNNETLATSELLKSKKACWKNIYAVFKLFESGCETDITVWDKTVEESKPFVYDINGIKKKAGVRK